MTSFKERIAAKKKRLARMAADSLSNIADASVTAWHDPEALDNILLQGLKDLPCCHMIYAVDTNGILISANVESNQLDTQWRGRDLNGRPYLDNTLPYQGLTLSPVYTSRHNMRPCITVMQAVRHEEEILGFIAADYNIDDLPEQQEQTTRTTNWKQYKGDPAIRGTLFLQERVVSAMDEVLDEVIDIITGMMQHHGIFHAKIHFSSSRASFWSAEDPFDYSIHPLEEIVDPERCLAYPRRPLHERAQVSADEISLVLNLFKHLRNADETVYLRSASFNLINGMVGLTFSCDGSHYIHYSEFLSMDTGFWFGETSSEAV